MTTKLTREQLKGLTAEEKIAYQQALNRERVAKYRGANKEKADKYNREYKKDYINRPENRDKYKELNRKNVERHNRKKKQVLASLELVKANKTGEKLDKNRAYISNLINEGKELMKKMKK